MSTHTIKFTETGSNYQDFLSITGGAINCRQCTSVSITGATFSDGVVKNGGIISMSYSDIETVVSPLIATLTMSSVTFTGINALYNGGIVYIEETSSTNNPSYV